MPQILFIVSLLSAISIVALSLYAYQTNRTQFWPPPKAKSWQHIAFNILFRGFLYSLLILTYQELNMRHTAWLLPQTITGGLLVLIGFGLAFRVTFQMGWRNAFGEQRGLHTKGWFAHSRNPVYVATWVGLLGWGLIAQSTIITALLALWAALYVLAVFLEEPWLERQYGSAYRAYKDTVPRFLFGL